MGVSYDVHTHVGLDLGFYLSGWWPYACTAQELVGHLDRAGLDRAICFPLCLPSAFDPHAFAASRSLKLFPDRIPFDVEDEALIREIKQLGLADRLLPFAMFDPARCVPQQLTRLETLAGRIGGLKTQTTVLQSPISDLLDSASDFMTFAQRHDLPVLIHTAVHPDDHWAHAADCLRVARAYPQVRFNLAHSLRFDARCLRQAAELPNVWIDCSAHLIHCHLAAQGSSAIAPPADRIQADFRSPVRVLEAVHLIVGDRYLWGSDHPFSSWCDDELSSVFSYAQEASLLDELEDSMRISMTQSAPHEWLFGKQRKKS